MAAGIAGRLVADAARQDRVETQARERLGLPTRLVADDSHGEVERQLSSRRMLEQRLAELPDHVRDAIDLRIIDELGYDEAARRLNIRPAAARLRVSRALRRLRGSVPRRMVNETRPSLTRFRNELERALTRELANPEPNPPPRSLSARGSPAAGRSGHHIVCEAIARSEGQGIESTRQKASTFGLEIEDAADGVLVHQAIGSVSSSVRRVCESVEDSWMRLP